MIDKEQNTLESEEATPDSETLENSEMTEEEESVNVVVLSAEEFEQMKAENEEKQKQMLYTIAEYENSRKRTEREKEDFLKYATENFVKDLIPVMDSIDHAVEAARSSDTETEKGFIALREGVELIQKQFLGSLEKRGVLAIETEGETFDPQKHEAISMAESEAIPENNIIQAFQKGYILHDRVVRPSMVVVSKGCPETTEISPNDTEQEIEQEKEQIENE
ncbi:MAG: nucleotide exchange factor GrpE [Candidatus Poribacteria bacterium]|jgi:molecular chaperone GrpE|nr:nucleotide exchange factor GrpE [Candidatus Poribacteria bacterium]MDP6749091.1 nucleotide exchange factor GrpE [Candidatus Poribacteria bacterium]MDP6960008.1 nucleotide exchange factor GrpE [Dehalococcoidia bacterium]